MEINGWLGLHCLCHPNHHLGGKHQYRGGFRNKANKPKRRIERGDKKNSSLYPHPPEYTCFPSLSCITLYLSPLSSTIKLLFFFWIRIEINYSVIFYNPSGRMGLEITTTTSRPCSNHSRSRVPKLDLIHKTSAQDH